MNEIMRELIRYALECNCSGYEYDRGEPDLTDDQWATLYAMAVELGFDWPACGLKSFVDPTVALLGPCTRPQQHPDDHQGANGQAWTYDINGRLVVR